MDQYDVSAKIRSRGHGQRTIAARGNLLDRLGNVNTIGRFWQTATLVPRGDCVEFMQFGDGGLRPFLILNSLEYPWLPPQEFCSKMERAGFFTLVVQRPGFGVSTPAANLEDQARVIENFITQAGLENVVLMSMGTSVPVGYRLAIRHDAISATLLVNAAFNKNATYELRPHWLARLVRQSVSSDAMARAGLSWIKGNVRLFGHRQLFEKWYSKHPGDLEFLHTHPDEFDEVAPVLMDLDVGTFRNDIRMLVEHDPFLCEGRFSDQRMMAISGAETAAAWRQGLEAETRRLGIAHEYLPSGSCFSPFLYPGRLMEFVDRLGGPDARQTDRLSARA